MNMLPDDMHLILSILARNLNEGADERAAAASAQQQQQQTVPPTPPRESHTQLFGWPRVINTYPETEFVSAATESKVNVQLHKAFASTSSLVTGRMSK